MPEAPKRAGVLGVELRGRGEQVGSHGGFAHELVRQAGALLAGISRHEAPTLRDERFGVEPLFLGQNGQEQCAERNEHGDR